MTLSGQLPRTPATKPSPGRFPVIVAGLLAAWLAAAETARNPIAIIRPERSDRVSFHREVLPVLQANCLPCHNQTRAKAGLVLETPATILRGGDSGPAVIPRQPTESLLLKSAAHQVEDLVMPPVDNQVKARNLTPAELGLLWLWVEQGAEGGTVEAAPLAWQALPTNWVSSFAVALTDDGHLAAVARGNRVFLYDSRSGHPMGQLSDPKLEGAAQRDWVSALAFSPDGEMLAAAGYREVRLWRRLPARVQPVWQAGAGTNWIAARFSPHQTRLAVLTADGRVEVFNVANGASVGSWAVQAGSPAELAWSPDGQRLVVAGTNGAAQTISPASPGDSPADTISDEAAAWLASGQEPAVPEHLRGDPRLADARAATEHELALSRLELARAGALIGEAETATKSGEASLTKAREKRDAQAAALAEKEKELAQHRSAEAAATQERDEIGAELQRITEAAQAAEQALAEAHERASTAAGQDGAAQVAASQAEQLYRELERLAAALPESDMGESAAKVREAAASAAAAVTKRGAQRSEAGAAASQARQALADQAFVAGQRNAEAERAKAELPPRKKLAEERLATAQKVIAGLQPQVEKARIALDGGVQDFVLAEKAVTVAAAALAEAREAEAAARKRIAAAEARLEQLQLAAVEAAAVPLAASVQTPDGAGVLTISRAGLVSRWDRTPGTATATFAFTNGIPLAVAALGAHEFAVVFPDTVLRVDTSPDWVLERSLGSAEAPAGPFVDRVNALAFSPDGQLLATGGGEPSRAGELKLWRTGDGELVRDFGLLHSDCVMSVAFSPRGEWLASGGADRFARLVPVTGDGPRLNFEGHAHHVLGVAWQADGSILATAGAEGVVKLWNPKTGERRKNVESFGKEVTGLKPLGLTNQFVAVAGSGQGRIFRNDGEKVRELAAAPVFLQALAVSRDGTLAAGAGDDGVLRLWNPATGEQRLSLPPE